jgi:hypothetical protein
VEPRGANTLSTTALMLLPASIVHMTTLDHPALLHTSHTTPLSALSQRTTEMVSQVGGLIYTGSAPDREQSSTITKCAGGTAPEEKGLNVTFSFSFSS